MVIVVSLVLVVVIVVAVVSIAAAATTHGHGALDSCIRSMPMSEYRTLMSAMRTLRALSLLTANLWHRSTRLPMSLMVALYESEASPPRARPVARARSPCSVSPDPENRAH